MGPTNYNTRLKRLAGDKHSSFMDLFISHIKNISTKRKSHVNNQQKSKCMNLFRLFLSAPLFVGPAKTGT